MIRTVLVGIVLAGAVLTSARLYPEEKPRLVVTAPRVQILKAGLAAQRFAKRVEAKATLEGDAEHPGKYYCLDEVWDWGDGTESVHESDCDPYEEGKALKTEFANAHYYRRGTYVITLALMNMDDVVIQGTAEVNVR